MAETCLLCGSNQGSRTVVRRCGPGADDEAGTICEDDVYRYLHTGRPQRCFFCNRPAAYFAQLSIRAEGDPTVGLVREVPLFCDRCSHDVLDRREAPRSVSAPGPNGR